jgi:hypothetical protein
VAYFASLDYIVCHSRNSLHGLAAQSIRTANTRKGVTREKESPISRPVSRGEATPFATPFACFQSVLLATFCRRDRARFFVQLAANESHQSPIGIKRMPYCLARPGGFAAPEKRWYQARVQAFRSQICGCRFRGANPLVAHGLGDSIWQNGGRSRGVQSDLLACRPNPFAGSPRGALKAVTRSSASAAA